MRWSRLHTSSPCVLRCSFPCNLFSSLLEFSSTSPHIPSGARQLRGQQGWAFLSCHHKPCLYTGQSIQTTSYIQSLVGTSVTKARGSQKVERQDQMTWGSLLSLWVLLYALLPKCVHGSVPQHWRMCVLPFKSQHKFASCHMCLAVLWYVCPQQCHKK